MAKKDVNSKYICVQACQLGGKRYEVNEFLADGVTPNSHFKNVETGEMVKPADSSSKAPVNKAKEDEDTTKLLEAFKEEVGKHLAKFDKRIEALEKAAKAKSEKKGTSEESTSENDDAPSGGNGQGDGKAPEAPKGN